jgi:hypothetical protein
MLVLYTLPVASMYRTCRRSTRLYLEAVSSHTLLVLVHEGGAFFLRIVRRREKHTFVALSLLFRAYTARQR